MGVIQRIRFDYYRFRWHLSGWLAKWDIVLPPVHIDVEINSDCNLRCTMCPYSTTYTQRGFMPDWMAKAAIDDGKRMGCKSIKFQFRGEPGLNKNLEQYVKRASDLDYTDVFINTNALAFTPARIRKLKENGLTRAIISVDGATQETYESIRVNGDWQKLKRNARHFIQYGPPIKMQMTVQASNSHEVEAFKAMWPGAEVVANPERTIGTVRRVCPQPYRRMIVAYDGTVFGCCNNWNNEFPVGNFYRQPLRDIWRGEKMTLLRQHARNGTGPCKTCTIREAWRK